MSVRCEHYLILGAELSVHGKRRDDIYNDLYPLLFPWCGKGAKGKMGVLWDGMGDRYVIAGKCLQVATDEEGFTHTSFGTEVSPGLIADLEEWMMEKDIYKLATGAVSIHLLSHYH